MRVGLLSLVLGPMVIGSLLYGCGSDGDDDAAANKDGGIGALPCTGAQAQDCGTKPGCVGLECQQVDCGGGKSTTLKGIVYDPAGKVPVFNAFVYVPNGAVAPLTEGVTCDRCDAKITGSPIASTQTDTSGAFTLTNVPVGAEIPVVIQIGKWRRQIKIPNVERCAEANVDAALTRLPRNRTEGDIPRIAIATGAADPLQCLLKKVGLDDSEFGVAGSESRIHLFAGGGFSDTSGTHTASASFAGGASFTKAETLWGTTAELSKYDVVLLSCEGIENDTADHRPASAKQALYDYAKAGGRVFSTHFHHVFFSASPDAAPKGVAAWTDKQPPALAPNPPSTTAVDAEIVGTFPKAVAMKEWLTKQNALENGKLKMFDARHNVDAVNAGGLNWISAPNANLANAPAIQYLTFNAPVGAADDQVCGRVVFSNLHVGAGTEGALRDDPSAAYPTSCQTKELSPQQKALEFMLFDLSSCVQKDDAPIQGPK